MADTQITFTIPEAKVQRVIDAMVGLNKIPKIADPNWENPNDGTRAPLVDQFTPAQWAKECPRRWIRNQVRRFENRQALIAAQVELDDEIIEQEYIYTTNNYMFYENRF